MSHKEDPMEHIRAMGLRHAAAKRGQALPQEAQQSMFDGAPGLAARQAPHHKRADRADPGQTPPGKIDPSGPRSPEGASDSHREGSGIATPPENVSTGLVGVSDPKELQKMETEEAIGRARDDVETLLGIDLTELDRARCWRMLSAAPLPWPVVSDQKPDRAAQSGFGTVPGLLEELIRSTDSAAANLARNEFIMIVQGQSSPRRAAKVLAFLRERVASAVERFAAWDEATPLAGDAWGAPAEALAEIVRSDASGTAVTRLWSPRGEYLGLWPPVLVDEFDIKTYGDHVTISADGEHGVLSDELGRAYLRGELNPVAQPTGETEGWRTVYGLEVRPFTGPLKVLIVEGLETLCKVSAWAQRPKTIVARGGMPVLGFVGDAEALGDVPWREGDVALVKRATIEQRSGLRDLLWRTNVEVL